MRWVPCRREPIRVKNSPRFTVPLPDVRKLNSSTRDNRSAVTSKAHYSPQRAQCSPRSIRVATLGITPSSWRKSKNGCRLRSSASTLSSITWLRTAHTTSCFSAWPTRVGSSSFNPNTLGISTSLNLVEDATLLSAQGSAFQQPDEMIEPIRRATAYWSEHKHPYVWGKRKRQRRACKYGVASLPNPVAF